MAPSTCLTVILAAGEGTRMRSTQPKVLHRAAGRTLLGHAVLAAKEAGASRIAVVVGARRQREGQQCRAENLSKFIGLHHETNFPLGLG